MSIGGGKKANNGQNLVNVVCVRPLKLDFKVSNNLKYQFLHLQFFYDQK